MNIFDIIRESVQMTDIVKKYGLKLNHSSFIVCPFHTEKTASLKIYDNGRGWYCYGCGCGGSVIDFVAKLFNIKTIEAIKLINKDFGLSLPIGEKNTYREQQILRQKLRETRKILSSRQDKFKAENEEYNRVMDEFVWADIVISALKPNTAQDELYDIYKEAVNKKVIAEYNLDCLGGDA